jgi:hypothetical protein
MSGNLSDGGTSTVKYLDAPALVAILSIGNIYSQDATVNNLVSNGGIDIRNTANWVLFRNGTATRWRMAASGTELGNNVGSDLIFNRRADDTSSIDVVMRMYRSSGNVRIGNTSSDPGFKLAIDGTLKLSGDIILSNNSKIITGTGSPEGLVVANISSLYLRTDGIPNSTFYIKESGNGTNVGWREFTTQFPFNLVTKSSNYTATGSDYTIVVDSTSGNITINLPTSGIPTGQIYVIKKIVAANSVTIDPLGSGTLDGLGNLVLSTQWSKVTVQFDGANYIILNS